jgi:hypothetical protein
VAMATIIVLMFLFGKFAIHLSLLT